MFAIRKTHVTLSTTNKDSSRSWEHDDQDNQNNNEKVYRPLSTLLSISQSIAEGDKLSRHADIQLVTIIGSGVIRGGRGDFRVRSAGWEPTPVWNIYPPQVGMLSELIRTTFLRWLFPEAAYDVDADWGQQPTVGTVVLLTDDYGDCSSDSFRLIQ